MTLHAVQKTAMLLTSAHGFSRSGASATRILMAYKATEKKW